MSGTEKETAATNEGPSRRVRILRRVLLGLLAIAIAMTAYNTLMGFLVNRADVRAERNPETGILVGAEPVFLGPEDAKAAVLLVHGFVGGSNNFAQLPERLAKAGFRVHAMRLPGHGTSPREFAKTPASEFIEAVQDEVRALRETHEQVFLGGHSMGGAISTLVATQEKLDGLILAAPYFGVTHHWYYGLRPETWTGLTAPFVRWVYKGDAFVRVKRPEAKSQILSYRWIPSAGTKTLVELGRLASDPAVLSSLTTPVLMLHAHDDQAAAPSAAAGAFKTIGSDNKKLVWLDNSDHHIFWDYDREQVIEEIIAFLQSLSSQH